ncbi:hypothetical protein EON65_58885 [archaeon]|nr:MAG: hypothetical protein EON65_58885 [archaeon]
MQSYLLPVMQQYFGQHPCTFQQDGASIHRAHEVIDFIHTHKVQVLEWPAHSPDLNIISKCGTIRRRQ